MGSVRTTLAAQLRERFDEIEVAVYAEMRSVSARAEDRDPEYLTGLRAAVAETINYGITGLEGSEETWPSPVPLAVAAQTRRAARRGVELGTVLRGYAAAERKLSEFIMGEAERLPVHVLQQVLKEQGPRADRLMAIITDEYVRELKQQSHSSARRLSARIKRLLANPGATLVDGVDYMFDAWHLGLIAKGPEADQAVRTLATALDREALISREGEEVVWGWLGGRRPLKVADIERLVVAVELREVSLALGEPRNGLAGWRLTHHEAQAAFRVMLRMPQRLFRGRDVALLAAVLRDEHMTEALQESYLRPLMDHSSGLALCRTLQAYLATGFNAVSTSQILQVDRSTVQRHLRKIEELFGRPLYECHAELKVVLELRELGDGSA